MPSVVTFFLGHTLQGTAEPLQCAGPWLVTPAITFFRFDRAISSFPSGKICPSQY